MRSLFDDPSIKAIDGALDVEVEWIPKPSQCQHCFGVTTTIGQ
jgi:hypothetical protein